MIFRNTNNKVFGFLLLELPNYIKYDIINFSVGHGFDAYNFEQSISKLIKNYHRLTMVEIESIIGISNRF